MPTRIVREGIISSARVNALSTGAEVFYRRLLNVVDDYGRYHGSVVTLRGACWPTCPDKVKERELAKWLGELLRGDRPLIRSYNIAGSVYIEIQDFEQQTRSKSKFPPPPWVNLPAQGQSCVYFVQAETSRRIKIGFTELQPQARLSTLQIGSPEKLRLLGTFPGSMADERATHKLFISDQIAGEWFSETKALLEFIAEKCAQIASIIPDDVDIVQENAPPSRSRISESKTESESNAQTEPRSMPKGFEYPKTGAAVCRRFPAADRTLVSRIIQAGLQAYIGVANPRIPSPDDSVYAAAVDEATSKSQTSAGLYMTSVPTVIASWAKYGRNGTGGPESLDGYRLL